MIRNLKALALTLVAACAISTAVAPGALATAFDSEASHTIFAGSQSIVNEFETGVGITECGEVTVEGTALSASSTNATLEPTIDECVAFGLESDVVMNGCDYLLTAHGQIHIEGCDPGEHIELQILPTFVHENNEHTDYFCAITIFEQTVGGITFQNTGSGTTRDLDIIVNATGITYEVDGGQGLCGEEEVLTHDARYRGTVTIKGFNTTGGHVSIWHTP